MKPNEIDQLVPSPEHIKHEAQLIKEVNGGNVEYLGGAIVDVVLESSETDFRGVSQEVYDEVWVITKGALRTALAANGAL